ncbi:hypothetical protein [Flavobacterium sp. 123]|jgi:hypothetical protein|uniref:hypothetical protein n=1 Tax=Flavobacterium sp. 123 TaxID=2135627 RepID=UPI000EAF5CC7|nr:hypothetical protein [Flavobacterium sp. 123]RKS98633.1 hypothetical protein C8C88_0380 [Flavobacterium sp. 123]
MFDKFLKRKATIVENTDPDRIFVENIRSFFNIPTRWAKFLCEVAVRQGVLKKRISIECSNQECGRIIKSYDKKSEIPETIICRTCELEGFDKFEFDTDKLNIVEYYQYIENGK